MSNISNPRLNPHTGSGIHLAGLQDHAMSKVIVHEVGSKPQGLNWNFDDVLSPFWRFYYNSRRGSYIEFKKTKLPLSPGQILIIPQDVLFNCRGDVGTPHLWIHFSVEPRYMLDEKTPFYVSLKAVSREVLNHVRLLAKLNLEEGKKDLERQQLYHYATALLHLCLSQHPLRSKKPLPASLARVLSFIQSSKTLNLSNKILAQQAGMSIEGFIRLFGQRLGTTPSAFIRQARINHACHLLAFTDQSIEEIASIVGFTNRHHFSRVFAQQIRCGPAAFRKRHK